MNATALYYAQATYYALRERHERLEQALSAVSTDYREIVERETITCRKELATATQNYESLQVKQRELRSRLDDAEPRFARNELFSFLKSKRYEISASNVAKAAAGLPYMGWRQSIRRIGDVQSPIANSWRYQIFKAIRYLTTSAKGGKDEALVAHFQKHILDSFPSRYYAVRKELADNWMFLQLSITEAVEATVLSRTLPYEITERFLNRCQSRNPVDAVLAEQMKLVIRKRKIKAENVSANETVEHK